MAFEKLSKGSEIFICENCDKKTRDTQGTGNTYCKDCYNKLEQENEE